jgi:hypothetical protein
MNNPKKLLRALIPLLCLPFALLLAGLTGYLYLFQSDVTSVDGIYDTLLLKSNGAHVVLPVLVTLVCAAFVIACLVFARNGEGTKAQGGYLLLFVRCATGVATAATLIAPFFLSAEGTPYFKTAENGAVVTALQTLALPAALSFLLPALFSVKNKTVLFFTGLFALLFTSCELLLTHYFMLDYLASPTRVFAVFGYSALILFFLLELKGLVYEKSGTALLSALGVAAFLINTADALPRLLLSFVDGAPVSASLTTYHTLFRLLAGLYALVAVLPVFLPKKKKEAVESSSSEEERQSPSAEEAFDAEAPDGNDVTESGGESKEGDDENEEPSAPAGEEELSEKTEEAQNEEAQPPKEAQSMAEAQNQEAKTAEEHEEADSPFETLE